MSNICTPILVVLAFFGDIATFQIWSIIMNPFSLSLPLSPSPSLLSSPPPPLLTDYITGSLVSLNDVTISLQPHTDLQMTNTRTLH